MSSKRGAAMLHPFLSHNRIAFTCAPGADQSFPQVLNCGSGHKSTVTIGIYILILRLGITRNVTVNTQQQFHRQSDPNFDQRCSCSIFRRRHSAPCKAFRRQKWKEKEYCSGKSTTVLKRSKNQMGLSLWFSFCILQHIMEEIVQMATQLHPNKEVLSMLGFSVPRTAVIPSGDQGLFKVLLRSHLFFSAT